MVEVGRLPARERDALLDELLRGAVYERRLAAFACFGSRDGERASQAALDPSRHVHGLAVRLVAMLCSDEQLLALLGELPASRHRPMLGRWRQAGRPSTPVDTWIEQLLEQGRRQEAWSVLPYASSTLVERLFPELLDDGGWTTGPGWERTARWHPQVAGQELLRRARASTEFSALLTRQVNIILPGLGERAPDLALALVREVARTTPVTGLMLWKLAVTRPQEVAALMLDSEDAPPPFLNLTPRLRRLPPEVIEALLRRRPGVVPGAEQRYGKLRSELRARLAPAFIDVFRTLEGLLPLPVVHHLPAELRVREARRHLRLPFLQTRVLPRLQYAAFLPWEEARAVLNEPLRSPDAEQRAQALTSLAFCIRYERSRQVELLALMTARRNEQDPVRQAMLRGLAELPPGLWQEESLDAAGQVIGDALNAADLSHQTAAFAERFVLGLLPFHPGWSAAWLARIVQARGQVNLGDMERRLTRTTAREVVAALLPVLRSWETREREGQLIQALTGLGKYVADSEDLLRILEERVRNSRSTWVSAAALGLLREHARGRFAALVPLLLRQDPSWATQPPVYEHLHRERQDLLTPFLGRQAFSGRFSTGLTRFVLPFAAGFTRWTLSQQQTFAQTLIELSGDGKRDYPGVWRALHGLAALPSPVPRGGTSAEDPPLKRLTTVADVRNTTLALRDTALRALGRLDEGRGVPALLGALEDDRARIAIYTLRRPLLDLPPDRALEHLLNVPRERVTVLKEVVRLIGDLPGAPASQALLAFAGQDLHRDVRVALLRALWNHLNRPETWPVLLAGARSGDAALSDGLVRLPGQNLTGDSRERYLELLQALLTHPEPLVRVETLHHQRPVTDPQRRLLGTLLGSLASPHEQETAAAARVIFASYSARDAGAIGEAFTRLLPDRRALRGAVLALQAAASGSRRRAAPIAEAVLGALAADPLTLPLQVSLATAALDWDVLGERLTRWAEGSELHAEALMSAVNALRAARHRPDVQEVEVLEQALADGPEGARRLALEALILAAETAGGWTPERLGRLRAYRANSSLLVASTAQFVLPEQELAEG